MTPDELADMGERVAEAEVTSVPYHMAIDVCEVKALLVEIERLVNLLKAADREVKRLEGVINQNAECVKGTTNG